MDNRRYSKWTYVVEKTEPNNQINRCGAEERGVEDLSISLYWLMSAWWW